MSIVDRVMQPSNELSPKERKDSGKLIVFKETHPLKDAASILLRDFPNIIFVIEEQPAKAKELGSDFIVVGRPITQAADPVAAYRRCVAEFVG